MWGATLPLGTFLRVRSDFNPRAPCGARPHNPCLVPDSRLFQSTRPLWGATSTVYVPVSVTVFQSTRPLWGATAVPVDDACPQIFQSTRPLWGATALKERVERAEKFQSTRPLWGATAGAAAEPVGLSISIHAPLVGRDNQTRPGEDHLADFNPRAPCGARHRLLLIGMGDGKDFNPRAPCGARRPAILHHLPGRLYFNPRAPCGARHHPVREAAAEENISIHAPLVGRDLAVIPAALRTVLFQSTRPLWGATEYVGHKRKGTQHFNPRAPCGARQEWLSL